MRAYLHRPVWIAAVGIVVLTSTVAGRLPARPPSSAASGKTKSGLHIPQTSRVNFERNMTDGGGFRWNIQHYGTVGQGTNYAYSGGLYCQINGSNVRSSGYGWLNKAGDEVEIGPYSRNNLNVYRRIKVYKDQPLARWLDIFENPTGQDITVQVSIYTNTNWPVVGKTDVAKGWAFITEAMGGGQNTPSLLHIVADKRSKMRPQLQIQNNQIYVRWNLTVPANKSIVLCYFESQNHTTAANIKTIKNFRPSTVLKDLPASVRKMIVNFHAVGGVDGLELERSDLYDMVTLKGGDPLFGTVANDAFRVETFVGPLDVPAKKVVGMALGGDTGDAARVLLADGQIICGRIPETKLSLKIADGGTLQVPFERIQQWAFRVSEDRPEEVPFGGAIAMLRSGDRVGFDPEKVSLTLRTRHGVVKLEGKDILSVSLDNAGNAVHRVTFLNGSRLGGFLEPEKISLPLKLGPKLDVGRNMITRMQFAQEDKPDATLTRAVLTNGDELYGRLLTDKIELRSELGSVHPSPAGVKTMTFSPTHLGRARMEMWNGSVYRGQLTKQELTFQIVPGPALKVYAGQFESLVRPQPLPPGELREKVEKLVARLSAESYKDRQAATEELKKMGAAIAPLLGKYAKSDDPEVRHRIEEILEHIGGNPGAMNTVPNVQPGAVFLGGRGLR